jgi:hypothetical protein
LFVIKSIHSYDDAIKHTNSRHRKISNVENGKIVKLF